MKFIQGLTKSILALSLLFLLSDLSAQGWEKRFGKIGNSSNTWESGYALLELSDGGFLVAADSNHTTFGRVPYIFRTDSLGKQLWNKFVQFGNQDFARFTDVIQNNTGTFTFFGHVNNNSSKSDFLLLTVDQNGNTLSSHFFGSNLDEAANELIQHSNGDYFLFGTASLGNDRDLILIRVDQNGNEIWQKTWNLGIAEGLTETLDGQIMMLSTLLNPNTNSQDIWLLKIDLDCNTLWSHIIGDIYVEQARDILATPDGGFIVLGIQQIFSQGQSPLILKIDAAGNELWNTSFDAFQRPYTITPTSDGNYILGGQTEASNNYFGAIVLKMDGQGDEIWRRHFGGGTGEGPSSVTDIVQTQDGRFALTGNHSYHDILLAKTDADGYIYTNSVSGNFLADLDPACQITASAFPLGGYWKVEFIGNQTFTTFADNLGYFEMMIDTGTYQLQIESLTNSFWSPCAPLPSVNFLDQFNVHDFGALLFTPTNPAIDSVCGKVFLDTDGDCKWDVGEVGLENYPVIFDDIITHQVDTIFTDSEGNYAYPYFPDGAYGIGIAYPSGSCFACQNWVTFVGSGEKDTLDFPIQCDSLISVISGHVLHDLDDDCTWSLGDEGLAFWQIRAVKLGSMDTMIRFATAGGFYTFAFDTGTYELTVLLPGQSWQACQATQIVVAEFNIPNEVNFLVKSGGDCPEMSVDLGTGFLRPCENNWYSVYYCNNGTAVADSVFLEVTLDSFMTFVNSPVPVINQNGQMLTFDLGAVGAGECKQFHFVVFLDCNSMIGQTHCIDAHIFPDTICDDFNLLWDMSDIEVDAVCAGDSVTFEIQNTGLGDMMNMNEFIVIEDNVLIRSGTYELLAGSDTTFVFYPDGTTLRLETDQNIGHPFPGIEAAWVEGCTVNNSGNFSLGFVTQYPTYASEPYMVTDCRESIESFDPNDKQGFPKGVTHAHFIRPNSDLEYLLRFQNTGTDTAFEVVLLDTISPFLNAESLCAGASSHLYEFELLNGKVAQFTFPNILLPDSATNELGSMGFVKFRINQVADNQPNTLIQNQAAIYFDNNPPILTNQTTHRIPAPQLKSSNYIEVCANEPFEGQFFEQDTSWTTMLSFAFFDSLHLTNLMVHPDYETTLDTTLQAGDFYKGIAMWQDTVLVENHLTEFGCDSLATTYISVNAVNVFEVDEEGVQVDVFPNPTAGITFLKFQLTAAQNIKIALWSAVGQKASDLIPNTLFTSGAHHLKLDLKHLPKGVYWVDIHVGSNRIIKKVVKD